MVSSVKGCFDPEGGCEPQVGNSCPSLSWALQACGAHTDMMVTHVQTIKIEQNLKKITCFFQICVMMLC